jgi:glycosyltransferase involved in cell wall biosynthesis
MKVRFLSVVVPAFNEAARIADTLSKVAAEIDRLGIDAEVLVVDDGSSDATASIVDDASRSDPRVKLVRAPHAGKGAAVRRGMLEATGAWRFLADADLSMPISELPRFIPAFAEGFGVARPASVEGSREARASAPLPADVVVGSREAAGATRIGEPWSRHAIGRVFNWLVKLLVLRGVDDTQCGFKLFSARAAETLFPLQRLDGFGFDVEILFLARRAGLVIREIPVTWEYHRETKVNVASGGRGFLDLVRIRWNQLRGVYPSPVKPGRRLANSTPPPQGRRSARGNSSPDRVDHDRATRIP